MANLTDEYLEKVLSSFESVDRSQAGKIKVACPYCSPGKKGYKKVHKCSAFLKSKTGNGSWTFRCCRCGASFDFAAYVEDRHPDLFREYHHKRELEGSTGKGFNLRKFRGAENYQPKFGG